MDYHEFRRHVGKSGLTINEFASFLNIKASAVSNYARKPAVPVAYRIIAVLMGEFADRKIDYRSVLKSHGITPSSVRPTLTSLEDFKHRRERNAL